MNSERVTYIGNSKFKSSELVKELSLQGTFFSSSKETKTDKFTNEWRENWGLNPSYFSMLAYDLALFVKKLSLEKDLLEKYKEPCPEALVESALRNISIVEDLDFYQFKVSVKSSDVFLSIEAYRQLSKVCDYPLHLGITEAGTFLPGSIKSSIGFGSLLLSGIGDTIRVSLSDDPVEEIKVGNEILKSLNLRNRGVKIISCPSCARQAFDVIETVKKLEQCLSHIKTPISLSIIGCVVNGPGEAAQTDIGITGGGKGNNMLYLNGVESNKISSNEMISKVVKLVEEKAKEIENA